MTLLVIAIGLTAALIVLWTVARWSRTQQRLASLGIVAFALVLVVPQLPPWHQVLTTVTEHTGGPNEYSPVAVTSPDRQPDLRLVVAGDVGTGDVNEEEVARLATRLGRSDPFDALVLLGDNAYPNGDPSLLPETVFEPFGEILASGAELLAVLGNHDIEDGHGDAQVSALGMPGRWYAQELGDVLFVGLDSTQPENLRQVAWAEEVLAGSDARWKIVALHHPPYSAGFHGSDHRTRNAFGHLFEDHEVQLVLSGHDHDYQRSVPIEGVTYIVSGGGSKTRPTGADDFTATSFSVRHVLDIGVWPDRLEVQSIGLEGVFDRVTIEHGATGLSRWARALANSR